VSGAYSFKGNSGPVFSSNPGTSNVTAGGFTITATATDADGDTLSYGFYVGTTSSNGTLRGTVSGRTSGQATTYNVTGLNANTLYYYYVIVDDGFGGVTTSVTGTVTTSQIVLANLITNGNFETNTTGWTGSITLARQALPGALPSGYSGSWCANLGNNVNSNTDITLTYTNVTGLTTGRQYYVTYVVRTATANAQVPGWSNNTTALGNIRNTNAATDATLAGNMALNTWYRCSTIWTATGTTFTPRITVTRPSGNNAKHVFVDSVMMIDLTFPYGAGNEPNTQAMDAIVHGAAGYFTNLTI